MILLDVSMGQCLFGMIFGKPRRTQWMVENSAFLNGLYI